MAIGTPVHGRPSHSCGTFRQSPRQSRARPGRSRSQQTLDPSPLSGLGLSYAGSRAQTCPHTNWTNTTGRLARRQSTAPGAVPLASRAERSSTQGSCSGQPWAPSLELPTCAERGAPGPVALRCRWHD
eukprot:scaffold105404_cov69-Phaeocystis_antarctica.AAC.1